MGNTFKRIMSTMLAVTLAATLCFIAIPTRAQAAVKTVKVTLTKDGNGGAGITLKPGAKAQIIVKKATGNVTYKTNNKAVVSVTKDGVIQTKKVGSAEIKVKDKKGYSATVCVDVAKGSYLARSGKGSDEKGKVYKIWLSKPAVTLDLGEGYSVWAYTIEEGKTGSVQFQSEDWGIAAVDDHGNIRAQGHGSTRIYAHKGGRTAAIMVNVN
ncbi:hypothetical protein [Butyrivibrio sp. INlla16]|uniref:hypothetical protein n=1 Tax=Butyrivibrio sp. INlla16 TaxID=1520807 RepID=UPI00087F526E|nr:hypothetical protein [Butyrivibrio sp. INlla16]SDB03391.1 hypothetical protein SAMN02910263_00111 [Butyrivibrio sp. INlla16]